MLQTVMALDPSKVSTKTVRLSVAAVAEIANHLVNASEASHNEGPMGKWIQSEEVAEVVMSLFLSHGTQVHPAQLSNLVNIHGSIHNCTIGDFEQLMSASCRMSMSCVLSSSAVHCFKSWSANLVKRSIALSPSFLSASPPQRRFTILINTFRARRLFRAYSSAIFRREDDMAVETATNCSSLKGSRLFCSTSLAASPSASTGSKITLLINPRKSLVPSIFLPLSS